MNISYSLSMEIYSKTQTNEIALALKSGKAVVLPTDTVWGIVCLNEHTIYSIKSRPIEKKVSKFIASIDDLGLPSFFVNVLKQYIPGALSFIWKNVSYRVPNCSYLLDILRITGPLYQSSANISGQQPITSSKSVSTIFKNYLDRMAIVDEVPYEPSSNQPSTIIDLDHMKVIRNGQIDGQIIINKLQQEGNNNEN